MNNTRVKKTRSRLAPDERIAAIKSVTRQMMSENGYEGIVTSEVAIRCGISEATIYKYFESKRDLLTRVAEEWFEELLELDKTATVTAATTIQEQLRHYIHVGLSIIRSQPSLSRFILMELRADPSYKSLHIYELNQQYTTKISSILQHAVEIGEFRSDVPVRLLRDMIFGCIEHQTWGYLRGEGDFSVEETTEHITNVIYRGMVS